MLTTVWIGLAGALLMFAGDMLLYYTPEDFSNSAKSSSEEKINAIIDVMKHLPAKRVINAFFRREISDKNAQNQ